MIDGPALIIPLLAAIIGCSGYAGNQDSCLRFGGGSCSPLLNPIYMSIQEEVAIQPLYVVFTVFDDVRSHIDNVCYTYFPLPDDSNTYHQYLSRVFNDTYHDVSSYILTEVETGVRRTGTSQVQFTDTVFAYVQCEAQPVYIHHRYRSYGDFVAVDLSDAPSGVVAFSPVRRPISKACLNKCIAAILNNGLPNDDFITLPMKLPSRCVLNQVCTVTSSLQMFCQTVGLTFPIFNRCANQNY